MKKEINGLKIVRKKSSMQNFLGTTQFHKANLGKGIHLPIPPPFPFFHQLAVKHLPQLNICIHHGNLHLIVMKT